MNDYDKEWELPSPQKISEENKQEEDFSIPDSHSLLSSPSPLTPPPLPLFDEEGKLDDEELAVSPVRRILSSEQKEERERASSSKDLPLQEEEFFTDIDEVVELDADSDSMEMTVNLIPPSITHWDKEKIKAFPRQEDPEYFRKEGKALASCQAERAALMWIEAARISENQGKSLEDIVSDLDVALELLPNSEWLMMRARRILVYARSFDRTIKLDQRKVKLGGDNTVNAALLLEDASIVRYHIKETKIALQLLHNALQIQPHYVPALLDLAFLSSEMGQHAEAAKALEHLGDVLTDPNQRALCLYRAGIIREHLLQDKEGSQTDYLRATENDPQNIPAAFALAESYRFADQWLLLSRSLEHLAEIIEHSTTSAEFLLEAAALHIDRTGDLVAASRDLLRAVRTDPDNKLIPQRLAYVYQLQGRKREALEMLRQLQQMTFDKEGQATILTQIGGLHSELGEPDRAQAAYREALELVPGFLPAIQEFGTLCRKRGDFSGLVEIARLENESLLPSPARAIRYVEIGEILDKQLGRPDEAAEAYLRAIDLAPTLHLAYWALAALYRRHGWYDKLAALLERLSKIAEDPHTRAHLLIERSLLQSNALGDSAGAIETLQGVSEDAAPTSVVFYLIELYVAQGRHTELVALLLKHAQVTKDPVEAENRQIWAALLLEQNLQEYDKALDILKEVIKNNPSCYAAIHSMGRILHYKGAWEELVKLYHHELSIDKNRSDSALLLCRMGRIIEQHLGNQSAAIKAYAHALRADPSYTPALLALEGLVHDENSRAMLVKALQSFASGTSDNQAGLMALCRAGDIAFGYLSQPEQAIELYQEVLNRDPNHRIALIGLFRVKFHQQQWPVAIELLERLVANTSAREAQALYLLQLARLQEFALHCPPDLSLYQQAAESPLGDQLRDEVIWVKRKLGEPSLAKSLADLGRKTTDDSLAAAYLLDAAHCLEFADEPNENALDILKTAFDRRPGDLAIVWALERALGRADNWAELAKILENQAKLELDRTLRVQQLINTADVYWQNGSIKDAERISRECLNFDTHCLPALFKLSQIANMDRDWKAVAELCDRLVAASTDVDNRLQGCLYAASIWTEKVGDPSRALASLAMALADDIDQMDAFSWSESLLTERGDFSELSRLYQRRIRVCSDNSTKTNLLWRHAQLLRDHLKRPDLAISELNELLRISPKNRQVLLAMPDLHEQLGHWSDAASGLELLLNDTKDAKLRRDIHLRLANIWIERLHDPKRAKNILQTAIQESGVDFDIMRKQTQLAMTVGDWDEARRFLEDLVRTTSGGNHIWALLQFSQVMKAGFRDQKQTDDYFADAILYAAANPEAMAELRLHYPSFEDKRRLVETVESLIATKPPADVVSLREVIVKILIEDLDDPVGALPHVEKLNKETVGSVPIALLKAKALEKKGLQEDAGREYQLFIESHITAQPAYDGLIRVAPKEQAAAAATIAELLFGQVDPIGLTLLKALETYSTPKGAFPPEFLYLSDTIAKVEEMLRFLVPTLIKVYPRQPGNIVNSGHEASIIATQLANTLGIAEVVLELEAVPEATIILGEKTTIVLPQSLAEKPTSPSFRALVGRALAFSLNNGAVLHQLDSAQLEILFSALLEKSPASSESQRLRKTIMSHLPRKERKQLESIELINISDLLYYRQAREHRADRISLILSHHPGVALMELATVEKISIEKIANHPRFIDLIRFSISEEYMRTCRLVWGSDL